MKIFEAAGAHAGALRDIGNFPDETIRERGLGSYSRMPPASATRKAFSSTAAVSRRHSISHAVIAASKRANFKCVSSIEYEGPGHPYEGVQHVVNELEKYL